jgi:hypothetical protein
VEDFDEGVIDGFVTTVKAIAARIDWSQATENGARARHKWMPILLVAMEIGDEDFVDYVEQEIKNETAALTAGQDEEPRMVVYRAVLAEATADGGLIIPLDRVDLAAVKRRVREDNDWFNDYQIGQTLRNDLGFETRKVGGQMRIATGGRAGLKRAADAIVYEDEWFEMTQEKEEPDK